MELFKEIFMDWLLFGILEAYIFCLAFEKLGNSEKYKLWEILVISVINTLIGIAIMPPLFQVIGILYMGIYNKYKKCLNCKMSFGIPIFITLLIIITEVVYTIILQGLISDNLFMLDNNLIVFIYLLPSKLLQIFIIINFKKWWCKL